MKRAHVSPLLLVLTAVISLSCGVGITMVAEDVAGVAYSSFDPNGFSLPADIMQYTLEKLLDFLAEHPDLLSDDLLKYFEDLIEQGLADGSLSEEDLMRMLQENPGLADALKDKIMEYLNNIPDSIEEGEEPGYSGSANSDKCPVDDGSLQDEGEGKTLFTVSSTYAGLIYIRNTSYGDYLYGEGTFDAAPSFDSSTYMVSPLLYPGFSMGGFEVSYLTFNLGDYSDYGMLVPDYCGDCYYEGEEKNDSAKKRFSQSTEARIRRTGLSTYTVPFYASNSPEQANVVSYLQSDESNYSAYVRANYRSVPEQMQYEIGKFIEENSLSNKTPTKVENFFKSNYGYAFQSFSPSQGEDLILSFLSSPTKEGTCTNFASAMTLICRSLGYSARMVGGYALRAQKGDNEVASGDAHAWVEVYSEGHGWVRYDPTPSEKGKDSVEQEMGSRGEVGDKAYDPFESDTLFSYTTDYAGDIYFRASSFMDYDPSSSSFLPDSIESGASSLLFASKQLERYYSSWGQKITMSMGDKSDSGMIFASYPSSSYGEGEVSSPSSYSEGLSPANDGRFFREGISEYTYSFYPDSYSSASYAYSDEEYTYRTVHRSEYLSLPDGYASLLGSFCTEHAISSLDNLANFFVSSCDLENEQSGESGDAIENFLSSSLPKGNSSVFAGVYVLVARYLGTPARFVAGYKVASEGGSSSQEVKESDAYYWVETYKNGFGWQKVDPISSLKARPSGKTKITLGWEKDSYEFVYDGERHLYDGNEALYADGSEALTSSSVTLQDGTLFEGDQLVVSFKDSVKEKTVKCGTMNSVPFDVKILDKHGNDVSELYEIKKDRSVTLQIVPREITVHGGDVELETSASSFDIQEKDLSGKVMLSLNSNAIYRLSYDAAEETMSGSCETSGSSTDFNKIIRDETEGESGNSSYCGHWRVYVTNAMWNDLYLYEGGSGVYNGDSFSYCLVGGTITFSIGQDGALAYGDAIASYGYDPKNLGAHKVGDTAIKNNPEGIEIHNDLGEDVTDQYTIDVEIGDVTIRKGDE